MTSTTQSATIQEVARRTGLSEPTLRYGPEPKPAPVISNAKAREVLGLRFRPAAETITETARSLARLGLI